MPSPQALVQLKDSTPDCIAEVRLRACLMQACHSRSCLLHDCAESPLAHRPVLYNSTTALFQRKRNRHLITSWAKSRQILQVISLATRLEETKGCMRGITVFDLLA